MDKFFTLRERRNRPLFKPDVLRQLHGQFFFRHQHHAAFWAMDDRNRRAPVPLAGNEPIAQAIIDLPFSKALRLRFVDDRLHRVMHFHAGEFSRVDQYAVFFHISGRHFFQL